MTRLQALDSEANTHEQIVQYMKYKHPAVIFRTDFAAGLKLPIWLAARQKKLQYKRGFPDLFIFQPVYRSKRMVGGDTSMYYGLAVEIKKVGVRLKKMDGSWSSDHIREQAEMMTELTAAGYVCSFACGYDEAIDLIEWYLNGELDIKFNDFIMDRVAVPRTGPDEEAF